MSVRLQQMKDNLKNYYWNPKSESEIRVMFRGLDNRSCNCARQLGIDSFADGKLLMTKSPNTVLEVRNAGRTTLNNMLDYFVHSPVSEWIPKSSRISLIEYSIKGFREAKITEEEWKYIICRWVKYAASSKSNTYVNELRRVYRGESLSSVAKKTNRSPSTVGSQMRKAIYILNGYIRTLPTYKTNQLLES